MNDQEKPTMLYQMNDTPVLFLLNRRTGERAKEGELKHSLSINL